MDGEASKSSRNAGMQESVIQPKRLTFIGLHFIGQNSKKNTKWYVHTNLFASEYFYG
jgi:hypothetical protein